MTPALGGGGPLQRVSYKLVLVGEPGAGKTSFLNCLLQEPHGSQATSAVEFKSLSIELPHAQRVTLQMWDIGGSTTSPPLLSTYLANCQAVLAMYDSTSAQSFAGVLKWLDAVKAAAGGSLPYLALVACKSDLEGSRAVSLEEHAHLARGLGMYSFYTSSVTGDGVKATAYQVASDLLGLPLSAQQLEAMAGPSREVLGEAQPWRNESVTESVDNGSVGIGGAEALRLGSPAAARKRSLFNGGSLGSSGRSLLPSLDLAPLAPLRLGSSTLNTTFGSSGSPTVHRRSPLGLPGSSFAAALPLPPSQFNDSAVPQVGLDVRLRPAAATLGGNGGPASAPDKPDRNTDHSLDCSDSPLADKHLATEGMDDPGAQRCERQRSSSPAPLEHMEISGVRRRKASSIWACCWG